MREIEGQSYRPRQELRHSAVATALQLNRRLPKEQIILHNEKEASMPTNLAIDDGLIEEARKPGRHRTKRETVNAALDEYIRRCRQQAILSLFGSVDYDNSYDYKRERRAARQ